MKPLASRTTTKRTSREKNRSFDNPDKGRFGWPRKKTRKTISYKGTGKLLTVNLHGKMSMPKDFYRQERIKAETLLTLPCLLVTEHMIGYIPLLHQLSF
jgi:hypothetical protein